MTPTRVIGGKTTPEQKRRLEGAEHLTELMAQRQMSRKQLIKTLLDDYAVEVSPQQLSYWLKGKWSPSPRNQAAIAAVFGVPAHFVFPAVQVEKVA